MTKIPLTSAGAEIRAILYPALLSIRFRQEYDRETARATFFRTLRTLWSRMKPAGSWRDLIGIPDRFLRRDLPPVRPGPQQLYAL